MPDKGNPQGLDRYAYVANGPVSRIDTSGHSWGFASGIREIPGYGTTCNNLDMALTIVQRDETLLGKQVVAGGYIAGEGMAHGALVAGAGMLACSAVGLCAAAETVFHLGANACADGDCTNEVQAAANISKNVASVTHGATKVAGNRYWTQVINFKESTVYQRPDLINPSLTQGGLTNLQRMQQGLAPIGPDGARIQLHHLLQTMDGPIAEVTQTFHRAYSSIIHINQNTIGSGTDRAAFNACRAAYWINRAKDFIDQ